MAAEIGYFALLAALLVSLAQAAILFVARHRRDLALLPLIDKAPLVQLALTTVAFGSLTYAATGNHDLRRSQPVTAATSFERDSSSAADPVAGLQAFAAEEIGPQSPHTNLPPVDQMIRRLAARLQQNPNDVQGWRTLGWSYLNTGRLAEAGEAYAKASDLAPRDPDIRSARIEALVGAADGTVTAEARNAIEETLKIDPQNSRARFFKALARAQDGDKTAALADWRRLLKEADPNEAWVSDLRNRISELERELGGDSTSIRTEPAPDAAAAAPPKPQGQLDIPAPLATGPNAQDVQAAGQMTPTDRVVMIKGMVERLANRLEKSPRDADGWIKLIQSRVVLGETELARQALARGLDAFPNDAAQRERMTAAARSFGLGE